MNDLRYALRALRRSPGFAIVAVLTLALGIGANTTIFSVLNAVLLRPPAGVTDASHLVTVYTSDFSGPAFGTSSYPDYLDFHEATTVFSGLTAYGLTPVDMVAGDETQRVVAELVAGNYFAVLGAQPAAGRAFLASEDEVLGRDAVVVISHNLWQRDFAGDPAVVGRAIQLNGVPFTVVGVAPRGFSGMSRPITASVWVPMAMQSALQGGRNRLESRGSRFLLIMGRLRPGATIGDASTELAVVAGRLHQDFPQFWTDVRQEARRVSVLPESASRVPPQGRGAVMGFMGILMGVVGIVLLIACANVASLLLARAAGRAREVAVRVSLGASRWQVVRQLVAESAVLALAGGLVGVGAAVWATSLLGGVRPPLPFPIEFDLSLDSRVLGFAFGATAATAVLFGLLPAWRATRPDLLPALRESRAVLGGQRGLGLWRTLVVAQVAASLVLVVGAGLFLRSLRNASGIDPGFDPDGILIASFALDLQGYSPERGREFYQELTARARALPGAASVALGEIVPLSLDGQRRGVRIEGYERQPGEDMEFDFNVVSAGYFSTMRIPLVRGREFTDQDVEGAPLAVLVNEAFARRFWPGEDPIGKRLSYLGPQGELAEVVGLVRDQKLRNLGEEPRPAFFAPYLQSWAPGLTLHVRTAGDPLALLPALRAEVQAMDSRLPLVNPRTLSAAIGVSLFPQRAGAAVLGTFGFVALVLAIVGLYGVLAYAVAQRTRELGIRLALGADRSAVVRMVVGQGARLAGIGLGIGVAGALVATRVLRAFLFEVSPTDPLTFASVGASLLAVAALAAYVPARRAARVDPVVALRYE